MWHETRSGGCGVRLGLRCGVRLGLGVWCGTRPGGVV